MTMEAAPQQRTLILHGGMHKTGSSAIQKYLFEKLDEPDVEYFSFDRANASMGLLEAFHTRLARLPRYKARGSTPEHLEERRGKARERFQRRLKASSKQTVIISAESFSLLNMAECRDLEMHLREHFSRIKLVLYIRPLYSRIESAFQQKLKKRFVPLEHKVSPRFKKRISTYDAVFGEDNVIIRPFKPSEFPGNSVVNDFLQVCGLPPTEASTVKANVGLSLPAVQVLYIYRQHFPVAAEEDDALVAQLSQLEGDRFRLHRDLLQRILSEGDDSYDWLQQRAGLSLYDDTDRVGDQVQSEQDMLSVSDTTLRWLEQQTGGLVVANRETALEDIARGLKAWALRLHAADEQTIAER